MEEMQQVTMRVEGFVTVTMPKGKVVPDDIPVFLGVDPFTGKVTETNEMDITEREIITIVDIPDES